MLLAGCSFASDALFPSITGGETVAAPAPARFDAIVAEAAGSSAYGTPPAMGSTNFEPPSVTPGRATGTFVGHKVQTYRDELRQLQNTIKGRNNGLQNLRNQTARDSLGYHETVAAINAKLQLGTTPGNPVLVEKMKASENQLNLINADIVRMNQLATDVAADSSMAAYLLDSVRAAFNLQGAVEEDHRQLRILEDETNQTVVLIERLLTELSTDITRQQQYLANEKSNLNTLAVAIQNGQLYGTSLANKIRAGAPQMPSSAPANVAGVTSQRPLVVIRFDRPNVAYEQALYQAVGKALERKPGATFDLVAVTPSTSGAGQASITANAARRNAEAVLRSLNNMGLPADRVRMSAMNSTSATSSEVHIYVR
ncbi:MAG: hypothetical protein H7840_00945 [Alphaproteobacteria bacterium]